MCFRNIELYRAVMQQHGDSAKRGLITEMGALEQTSVDLGQYAWMELPSDTRADYLVQALHMASTKRRGCSARRSSTWTTPPIAASPKTASGRGSAC